MNQKSNKKLTILLVALCVVLLAVAVLFATGVIDISGKPAQPVSGQTEKQEEISFPFVVVDGEGNETRLTVKTNQKMVGQALLDAGLVEGEMGQYGLYVKKVNGIEADYNVNQTYWAFYIDGQYAMTGVDETEIQPGATYMMKVEK